MSECVHIHMLEVCVYIYIKACVKFVVVQTGYGVEAGRCQGETNTRMRVVEAI